MAEPGSLCIADSGHSWKYGPRESSTAGSLAVRSCSITDVPFPRRPKPGISCRSVQRVEQFPTWCDRHQSACSQLWQDPNGAGPKDHAICIEVFVLASTESQAVPRPNWG